MDVVVSFLLKHGLSAQLAPALRAVGLTDHGKMRRSGKASERSLDRLEKKLAKKGVDYIARMLVRNGLCRMAEAAA